MKHSSSVVHSSSSIIAATEVLTAENESNSDNLNFWRALRVVWLSCDQDCKEKALGDIVKDDCIPVLLYKTPERLFWSIEAIDTACLELTGNKTGSWIMIRANLFGNMEAVWPSQNASFDKSPEWFQQPLMRCHVTRLILLTGNSCCIFWL